VGELGRRSSGDNAESSARLRTDGSIERTLAVAGDAL